MQKIVLTQANIGFIVGRLQKLMEGNAVTSQRIYNEKPSQVKRSKVFLDTSASGYCLDSKVTRHPFSHKKSSSFSRYDKIPLVHIAIHSDAGMVFSEGDVFYFHGPMVLIEEKSSMLRKDRVVCKFNLVQNPTSKLLNKIRTDYRESEAYAAEYWRRQEEEYFKELF